MYNKNEESIDHIVLWSGGYDSTALVCRILSEPELFNFKPNDNLILVSIINNLCGDTKNKREELKRKDIFNLIKNKYNKNISRLIINVNVDYQNELGLLSNNSGLSQPIIWTMSIFPLIKRKSILYFGYILEDQAMSMVDSFKKMIKACSELQGLTEDKLTFSFPFSKYTKCDIIEYLFYNDKKILDICTSCENSINIDNDKCGRCNPCVHLKQTYLELLMRYGVDTELHKYAKEKLKNDFNINIEITENKTEEKLKNDFNINIEITENKTDRIDES